MSPRTTRDGMPSPSAPFLLLACLLLYAGGTAGAADFPLLFTRDGFGTGRIAIMSPVNDTCPPTCRREFPQGTMVVLRAVPDPGSSLERWSGCDGVSGAECTVTMDRGREVFAVLKLEYRGLSVSRTGTGAGNAWPDRGPVSCGSSCSGSVRYGEAITFRAEPDTGSVFGSWTGCDSANVNLCTVRMFEDRNVTVYFDRLRLLRVIKPVDGGLVEGFGGGISCGSYCVKEVRNGNKAILSASPAAGYAFSGWAGCDSVEGLRCTLTVTADREVTAKFVPLRSLSVNRTGTGAGTVESAPAGILCGPGCALKTASFPEGTPVVLKAAPGDGATFAGWTGCDSVSGGACTVTMGGNRSVRASFVPTPPAPPGSNPSGSAQRFPIRKPGGLVPFRPPVK
jgi:hypothetical protein